MMFDPSNALHANHNLRLAEDFIETLDSSSPSFRYYKQEDFYTGSFFDKFKLFFNMKFYTGELAKFYPYQERIANQVSTYTQEYCDAQKKGVIITAILTFSLYQLARRGKTFPLLSKYGRYFGTHRLFRHYVWSIVSPTLLLCGLTNWNNFDAIQQMWAVHARRMNQGILDDPNGTRYPNGLLPINLSTAWNSPFVSDYDLPKKLRNETDLINAPDYQLPEFQTADLPEAEGSQQAEQDEDED